MTGGLFAGLAVLALAAGWVARRRIGRRISPREHGLSDEDVRQIEETGVLVRPDDPSAEDDEPLDMEAIREEEDRFWSSESWDEAEEH